MLKTEIIREGGRTTNKMSAFPAMISNEPPPIDSDEEDGEEFDDEFRSNGLHLDVSADPSPMSSPRKPPLASASNSNNYKVSPLAVPTPQVESVVSSSSTNNGVDSREDEDSNTSSVAEAIGVAEDTGDFAETCTGLQSNRDSPIEEIAATEGLPDTYEIPSLVNGTCSKSDDEPLECPEFKLSDDDDEEQWNFQHAEVNIAKPIENDVPEVNEDDDFGDFGDFTASEAIASTATIPCDESVPDFQPSFPSFDDSKPELEVAQTYPLDVKPRSPSPVPEPDFAEQEDEEDDFGDFASSEAKDSFQTVSTPSCSVMPSMPAPTPPVAPITRRESVQLEGRLDALIKSVFNQPSPPFSLSDEVQLNPLESIDKQLGNRASNSNSTWTHVQEFEDSNCLLHKWPRSGVHHLLLNSLNIDYSNIVYSAKYGTIQVPKFASSLVDSPLLPESVVPARRSFDYPPETDEGMRIERLDDCSPDADVSPIEEVAPVYSNPPMNKEAIRILEQLPDLSYMLAKTLVFPRHPNY